MIFILLRHGHKTMEPPENPSLSAKGHEQSRKLLKMAQDKVIPSPTICLYSEMIRTKQTLHDLIENYKPKTELKTDLNLRDYNETAAQFRARVQKLINLYTFQASQPENKNQVIYACTHYDWVEEAMTVIDCDKNLNSFEFAGWAPAQYLEFKITEEGQWLLTSRGAANV
ncbi:hypothetical protein CIK05_05335 [Bdellovibrio sp. qaytius]|nr:hypothetical protein CIK05_05335 [Bdellovibrio sp. qaytius]